MLKTIKEYESLLNSKVDYYNNKKNNKTIENLLLEIQNKMDGYINAIEKLCNDKDKTKGDIINFIESDQDFYGTIKENCDIIGWHDENLKECFSYIEHEYRKLESENNFKEYALLTNKKELSYTEQKELYLNSGLMHTSNIIKDNVKNNSNTDNEYSIPDLETF